MRIDELNSFGRTLLSDMKRIAIWSLVLPLISCASQHTSTIFVAVSNDYFMIENTVITSQSDLTIALKSRHADLVELRNIGKPSYHQVEQAIQAVNDSGAHLNMIGTVSK